jgi:hypothetical protein
MDRRSLYDEDVYAWAKQQADALRRLARAGRDLPNELDLENVAEEIEDVGKSELSKVESFIQLTLVHLLKAASVPQACAYRKWMIEVRVFRAELLKNLTRAMRQNIDIDELWGLGRLRAEADLLDNGDEISPNLPGRSPFSLEDLTAGEFDFDAAVARIRPHP